MLTYRTFTSSNFYECFRHGVYGSEDCSKIVKFFAKTVSHLRRSGDVDDDLLKKVITCDESWIFGYDIEAKSQWKPPEEPRPKKARQVLSYVNVLQ